MGGVTGGMWAGSPADFGKAAYIGRDWVLLRPPILSGLIRGPGAEITAHFGEISYIARGHPRNHGAIPR